MNRLLWPASLTLLLLIACTVHLTEPEGRACDAEHPCKPGLSCQGGTCVLPDVNEEVDGGQPDGAVDGGVPDAGVDAGEDAGVVEDAGSDAGWEEDAGSDAGMEEDAGYPPNTFFVDPAGDDSNDGRSPSTPWKTVAKVNGAPLPAGSWVVFKGGAVWNESLTPTRSGAQDNPIVFGAYGTGRPVLDGTGAAGNSAVNVNSKSWIVVRDLELRGWHNGFQLVYMSNTHFVSFENLYLHDGDKGFHASPSSPSTDITIKGCVVRDISGGTFTHGLSVPAGGTHWVISDSEFSSIEQSCVIDAGDGTKLLRNKLFNCGKLTSTSDKHGLYLRGPNTVVQNNQISDIAGSCVYETFEGLTAEGNQLHGCGHAGLEWAEVSTQTGIFLARRNRIWDVPVGISLGAASAQTFQLSNNSIHTVLASGVAATTGIEVKSNTGVAVENNLVTGSAPTVLSVSRPAPAGTFVDRTNDWHSTATSGLPFTWNGTPMTLSQYRTASGQTTSTGVDPLLKGTTAGSPDFTLLSTSPVRDFGVTNPATGPLTPGCDGAADHYCGAAPEPGALELLTP